LSRRAWAVVGVFLFFAGAGCRKKNSEEAMPTLDPSGEYSQVLKDFQMQDIFNGAKNMVVQSVEGRLFEKAQRVDVDKPHVTFYKKGKPSSVLDAPQGQVKIDTHEIKVWGGVVVVTRDSATLSTEALRYDPKTEHLISTHTVRLEKPDSVTVGTGLDADPDLSRVKIGRQTVYVKGHH
jgi:LPS export ABC transporter protein LptC